MQIWSFSLLCFRRWGIPTSIIPK